MSKALKRKSDAVFEKYKNSYVVSCNESNLTSKQLKHFQSMSRQHTNSHITGDVWISHFNDIKGKLDTRENMQLDKDLQYFLDSKFAVSDLKKGFRVARILDKLDQPIREFYDVMLKDRDSKVDEFSMDCFAGVNPEDLRFFERRFYPAALFYTYCQVHCTGDRHDLMNEVFSLGAGSMTMSMMPEITGMCRECQNCKLDRNASQEEIEKMNMRVFEEQVHDNFQLDYDTDTDEDDESSLNQKNSVSTGFLKEIVERESISEVSTIIFNPFVSEVQNSEKPVNEGGREFQCELCPKKFSREEFLSLHHKILHSKKKLVTQFVDLGEELITTFEKEPYSSPSSAKRAKRALKFDKN